jgi:ATP synthase protein I
MGMLDSGSKKNSGRDLRQIGLLTAVPAMMLAAPLIGFGIGWWLDDKLDTEPYLTVIGAFMGVASAGIEIYRLVKKADSADDEGNDGTNSGT